MTALASALPSAALPRIDLARQVAERDARLRDLRDGACGYLRSYLATGCLDFYRCARDRARSLGLILDHVSMDRGGAELLLDHLANWW